MKVAWVSHTGTLGGAEYCLLEAVRALGSRGVESHVIVPSAGALSDALSGEAIVHMARYDWWMGEGLPRRHRALRTLQSLRAAIELKGRLARIGPDVVITNTLTTLAGALAAWLAGIPHVWYIHEFGDRDHGYEFDLGARLSYALIGRLSRRIIVNSRAVEHHFRPRFPAAKLRRLYYAVEPTGSSSTDTAPDDQHCARLVLIGVKAAKKGQEDAIRAVRELRDRGAEAHLDLVGAEDADYGGFLRDLVRELGIEDRIGFFPFGDPSRFLARAHIALMCSRSEAFGRVTVEAMKAGKPVVGAAAGGTVELIRDGWSGLLYTPGDALDLAEKLEVLLRDPELRRTLGARAREWAEAEFTMERYADELERTLHEAGAAAR